jgi:hypothetical protein
LHKYRTTEIQIHPSCLGLHHNKAIATGKPLVPHANPLNSDSKSYENFRDKLSHIIEGKLHAEVCGITSSRKQSAPTSHHSKYGAKEHKKGSEGEDTHKGCSSIFHNWTMGEC